MFVNRVCSHRKVMSSRQMKEVEIALEVDAVATSELNVEVPTVSP